MVRAGLIGGKLGHSVSPQIHKTYGRLTGQDIRYGLHETDAAGLAVLLARLQEEGYAGNQRDDSAQEGGYAADR